MLDSTVTVLPPMVAKAQPQLRVALAPGAAPSAKTAAQQRAVALQSTQEWVARRLACPDERDGAYQAFLEAIASWGLLANLPLDSQGVLQVRLPFCGACTEAPLLFPFLARRCRAPHGPARGIAVHGADVDGTPARYWWPTWREWADHTLGPNFTIEVEQKDLAVQLMPADAGLILGVHPLVCGVGDECAAIWHRILANVLATRAPGAMCIFATFYRMEAERVQSVCAELGAASDILENPFYAGVPERRLATHLRFAVVVRSS